MGSCPVHSALISDGTEIGLTGQSRSFEVDDVCIDDHTIQSSLGESRQQWFQQRPLCTRGRPNWLDGDGVELQGGRWRWSPFLYQVGSLGAPEVCELPLGLSRALTSSWEGGGGGGAVTSRAMVASRAPC